MAKISIYVHDKLRQRMQAELGINWSKIAQAAFVAEMDRIDNEQMRREAPIIEPLLCFGS